MIKVNIKKLFHKKRRIIASAFLTWNLIFGYCRETQNYSTPLTHEKVILNQELNSVEDSHNSGKIIQTRNGTILKFQQEISDPSSNEILSEHNLNETDQVILVKNDGILPGADGFSPNNNFQRRHPIGHPRIRSPKPIQSLPPQNIQGLGNLPKGPKIRSFKEVNTGLDARRRNRGDQCKAPKLNIEKEYKMFMEDMAKKNIKVECTQQRFYELSVNHQTGAIDAKSLFEAQGGLQAEGQRIFANVRRPVKTDVWDFEANDINTGDIIFIDHKGIIDSQILADEKGVDISRLPNHEKTAYDMGQTIVKQRKRFMSLPDGPKSTDEILYLVNFDKIRNSLEKPSLVRQVLNGAEDAGCSDNIVFINIK